MAANQGANEHLQELKKTLSEQETLHHVNSSNLTSEELDQICESIDFSQGVPDDVPAFALFNQPNLSDKMIIHIAMTGQENCARQVIQPYAGERSEHVYRSVVERPILWGVIARSSYDMPDVYRKIDLNTATDQVAHALSLNSCTPKDMLWEMIRLGKHYLAPLSPVWDEEELLTMIPLLNENARYTLARSDQMTEATLRGILEYCEEIVFQKLAISLNQPELLHILAEFYVNSSQKVATENKKPFSDLENNEAHKKAAVRLVDFGGILPRIAENAYVSDRTLRFIAKFGKASTLTSIVLNTNASIETLMIVFGYTTSLSNREDRNTVFEFMGSHPESSGDLLRKILNEMDLSMNMTEDEMMTIVNIAENPETHSHDLLMLSQLSIEVVNKYLARNINTPIRAILNILSSGDWLIRQTLRHNENLPEALRTFIEFEISRDDNDPIKNSVKADE